MRMSNLPLPTEMNIGLRLVPPTAKLRLILAHVNNFVYIYMFY